MYNTASGSSWSATLNGHVTELAITSDGLYLAISVRDGYVYFYETEDLTQKWSFDTGGDSWAIDISDGATKIVAGNQNNEIYLLNHTGSQIWKYTGSGSFDHVHMSNGEYIVAGQSDGDLLLFDSGNSTPYGEYDIGTFISGGGEYILPNWQYLVWVIGLQVSRQTNILDYSKSR